LASDALEAHREREEQIGHERVAAIKTETDRLAGLLESNTSRTKEDKDLTEEVAKLAREIHSLRVPRDGMSHLRRPKALLSSIPLTSFWG
jgi:hypothetical protein